MTDPIECQIKKGSKEGVERVDRLRCVITIEGIPQGDLRLFVQPDLYSMWNRKRRCLLAMGKSVFAMEESQVAMEESQVAMEESQVDTIRKTGDRNRQTERDVKLTRLLLSIHPKNHSILSYRSVSPPCLNTDLSSFWLIRQSPSLLTQEFILSELALLLGCAHKSLANYAVWLYRRRFVILAVSSPHTDLDSTRQFVKSHLRDYSAYEYRKWLLKRVNDPSVWQDELVWVDQMLTVVDHTGLLLDLKAFCEYHLK